MKRNKHGAVFIVTGIPSQPGFGDHWDRFDNISELVDGVEPRDASLYDYTDAEREALRDWARDAKPGDYQEGWFAVDFIIAVHPESGD